MDIVDRCMHCMVHVLREREREKREENGCDSGDGRRLLNLNAAGGQRVGLITVQINKFERDVGNLWALGCSTSTTFTLNWLLACAVFLGTV